MHTCTRTFPILTHWCNTCRNDVIDTHLRQWLIQIKYIIFLHVLQAYQRNHDVITWLWTTVCNWCYLICLHTDLPYHCIVLVLSHGFIFIGQLLSLFHFICQQSSWFPSFHRSEVSIKMYICAFILIYQNETISESFTESKWASTCGSATRQFVRVQCRTLAQRLRYHTWISLSNSTQSHWWLSFSQANP